MVRRVFIQQLLILPRTLARLLATVSNPRVLQNLEANSLANPASSMFLRPHWKVFHIANSQTNIIFLFLFGVGLSARKLGFSLTQRQSIVPIRTTFAGVACFWILSWDGWIIELSVIRFLSSTHDRGSSSRLSCLWGFQSVSEFIPPVICFFLEPFKGSDFVVYISSFPTLSASFMCWVIIQNETWNIRLIILN